MRRVLLWMAGNHWLRCHLPRLWFVRRAVRRFLPGEDEEAALTAAAHFREMGIGTLFTRLGENVARIEESDEVAASYVQLLQDIKRQGIDGEVSVKLTQLGLDLDANRAATHLETLAVHAARAGGTIWIDMESSPSVDATLEVYERVHQTSPNIGICLQSYLHRTAADLQRLLSLGPSVRLVKGAYNEPASVAYQARAEIDANYLAISVMALEAIKRGERLRLGLGTHDVKLIEQVAGYAGAIGIPVTSFEVQMLYGIRVDQQRRLAGAGYVVRDLISYGDAWYPWYLRRLAERPANLIFVFRQLVSR